MKNDQFAVYRVDRHSEGRDLWHLSYQEAVSRKLAIRIEHYRQMDIRPLLPGESAIALWKRMKGFCEVSDVLVLNQNGEIYCYYVNDPERFGIVDLGPNNEPLSIVEKSPNPPSNYCVTGLYFYPKGVSKLAWQVEKSERGEYEITTLNNMYLKEKRLHATLLGRGYSWLDTGTHESLVDATNYVKILEEHQGIKICCPEEIAFINGWISKEKILEIGESMKKNQYGQHLINVATGRIKY